MGTSETNHVCNYGERNSKGSYKFYQKGWGWGYFGSLEDYMYGGMGQGLKNCSQRGGENRGQYHALVTQQSTGPKNLSVTHDNIQISKNNKQLFNNGELSIDDYTLNYIYSLKILDLIDDTTTFYGRTQRIEKG